MRDGIWRIDIRSIAAFAIAYRRMGGKKTLKGEQEVKRWGYVFTSTFNDITRVGQRSEMKQQPLRKPSRNVIRTCQPIKMLHFQVAPLAQPSLECNPGGNLPFSCHLQLKIATISPMGAQRNAGTQHNTKQTTCQTHKVNGKKMQIFLQFI